MCRRKYLEFVNSSDLCLSFSQWNKYSKPFTAAVGAGVAIIGTQATEATQTFVIAAAGVISADKVAIATESSLITINQDKIFSNVRPGY